jgi:hypothetical protein
VFCIYGPHTVESSTYSGVSQLNSEIVITVIQDPTHEEQDVILKCCIRNVTTVCAQKHAISEKHYSE